MKIKEICLFSLKIVSHILPSFLIRTPFQLAYLLTTFILKTRFDNILHIWPRNSFKSKVLLLGQSDLDLTIVTKDLLSKSDSLSLQKTYRTLKLFIPLLGEYNLYNSKSISQFKEVVNYFELSRDPILVTNYFSDLFEKQPKIPAEASTFLLRMIEADYFNLTNKCRIRENKWSSYLKHLEPLRPFSPSSPLSLYSLLRQALAIASNNTQKPEQLSGLIEILQYKENRDPSFLAYQYNEILMLFFPQIWIGLSILRDRFEQDYSQINSSPLWTLNFMLAQIDWELWGTYHQFYNISDYKHLLARLKHFEIIINRLDLNNIQSDRKQKRISVIKSLIQIIEQFHR